MNESPAWGHLDLSHAATKAVDLNAPCRETIQTKEAQLRVLLYGRLADSIGRQIEMDTAPARSVGELRRELSGRHPQLADALGRSRALVGRALVGEDRLVTADEELEFLPPVSGG
jgi:molybdopterin converting factor small subunit